MKIQTKTPCCTVPVVVRDTTKQDRRCSKCKHWWRVDVRLLKQAPVGAGKTFQSIHELTWTHIGILG